MKVTVFLPSDLARVAQLDEDQPSGASWPRSFSYEDRRSRSHRQALELLWRITNFAEHLLDENEQQLRLRWDAVAGGVAVGVGTLVDVDGDRYVCEPDGFAVTP